MRNIFAKKPKVIYYQYKVDLKSDATPQEIFEVSSLPQRYYYCLTSPGPDSAGVRYSYYLSRKIYEKLDENLKRHFLKETM